MRHTVLANRAPVLTLWAAVVASRQGYDWRAARTLGKAVAGLNAQSKGRMLGIFAAPAPEAVEIPRKTGLGEDSWVPVSGRAVPVKDTAEGIRAVGRGRPFSSEAVERYLKGKLGEAYGEVREAMARLAESRDPASLQQEACSLYERFRPQIAPGRRGWGQKGSLDLDLLRALAG